VIAVGASGLLALSSVLVSAQLTASVRQFGAIGVTFVLATWLLVLSALIVTGAVIGAEIALHSRHLNPDRHVGQSSADAQVNPSTGSSC
jgi:hypothetical protein